MRDITRLAKDR